MPKYIYENKNWTNFTWQETAINAIFGEVRNLQGKIIGQMSTLGFATKEEATFTTLTLDVLNIYSNATWDIATGATRRSKHELRTERLLKSYSLH